MEPRDYVKKVAARIKCSYDNGHTMKKFKTKMVRDLFGIKMVEAYKNRCVNCQLYQTCWIMSYQNKLYRCE